MTTKTGVLLKDFRNKHNPTQHWILIFVLFLIQDQWKYVKRSVRCNETDWCNTRKRREERRP